MIRWIKTLAAGLFAGALLASCGGGGGDPGTCVLCPPDGDGGGDTTTTYVVRVDVQRAGASITTMASTETVQAVARVVDDSGNAIEGALVTFSESGASLLKFAPSSGTALTDSDGYATLDVSAIATDSAGATTVGAAASLGGQSYTATKSISLTAGGVEIAEPSALNFVSVVPADKAIVIKGAGGSGRSESATLTFRVVDASNAPIKGVTVDFVVNPEDKVTLNIPSAVSDSNGLVTTTVHSGTQPTSVVVVASATTSDGTVVSGQSDTLVVSNGVVMPGGFEIVAEKYNLDGAVTGDSTTVTAFVRDENGNPVPDGVAVSFVTDFGGIGSSDKGACLTDNGQCTVDFRVQEPRGSGIATVTASVNVGDDSVLSDSIPINMAGGSGGSFVAANTATSAPLTVLDLGSSCKKTFELVLRDSDTGAAVTAGTVISVLAKSSDITAAVTSGTPVNDSLDLSPTGFTVEVNATSTSLVPLCNALGTPHLQDLFVTLQYRTPKGIVYSQRFDLVYPD